MKAWIGKTLVGIGIGHTIGAFTWFHPILNALLNEGLFNTITIDGNPERGSAFWFFFAGFALMIVGGLVDRLERLGENLPSFLGWGFAALTIVGAIIIPVSGFWFLIVPTIGMIRRRN